ncbi:MAG: 23S rRNA (pseudouridine(1915)-N(3))-methyltransferase RlmH [Bacteroidales bacterium]|nr:23S rRNA (pseudouridine(1915)-N(3))-methyltransferase RlmH [Bacteroidales bacterium]
MKITLFFVGQTADKHIAALIDDYVRRIGHYIGFDIATISEPKNTKNLSEEQQKEKEAELILKALQPNDFVVLFDEHGRELRSVELADWMRHKMQTVARRVVFIVGGPYGFAESIYRVAHEKLSLSRLTFSHQMVRLIVVEQIYRAFTIVRGEPYHHE